MRLNTFVQTKLTQLVFLLFALNFVDAVLTIFWVQSGIATETNHLMDSLLSIGVLPFLLFKIGMGTFAAVVFIYGANFRLAHVGVTASLVAYCFAMGAHFFTALAAYGLFS